VAIVYLGSASSQPLDPELAAGCELTVEVPLTVGPVQRPWRRRARVLTAPLTGVPSAVAALREPAFAQTCIDVAQQWTPDVIQVEHDTVAYLGPALRDARAPGVRVLTCYDPGPQLSADQATATRGLQRIAHNLDAAGWRRYWAKALPAFDRLVAFTEGDRESLAAVVSRPRITTIGLGVDLPSEPLSAVGGEERTVVYVGSYTHPPNLDAALRLLRSVMPAVRARVPGARAVVVGPDPPSELLDAATSEDVVTGMVDRVEPFIDQASLLALPIRLGGGMRVKLLEALAAGKAVVASRRAAAGLEVRSGDQLVLAESDEQFVEAIASLLIDAEARRSLGGRAREWALQNLTWEARAGQYERMYRSLLDSSSP
jgi:glycosyltransferase involved in cell wall biosynthesis